MKFELPKYFAPFLLALVVLLVMWPGVSGPFLLDDFLHFPKLAWLSDGDLGFWRFIFSDGHGSGRPLAFLSLLIEDSTWPTFSLAYKINNVFIHCINTLLVFWIALELFKLAMLKQSSNAQFWAAVLVAIWWGVHPIQLSPVMLTIQRMTLLMGAFVFLGVLLYLKARSLLFQRPKNSWLILVVLVPLCALLSILFKEPGILLPAFILILECSIKDSSSVSVNWRRYVWLVGISPLVLLIAYYFYMLPKMDALYATRDFNMHERLLTELRVLTDYVRMIALPTMRELGPYQDYYSVSRSLTQPVTTLLSLFFWVALIVFALINKFRSNVFSWLFFAVFWFLVGHVVESSFVPIELYFEHRNYVPMLGIILATVAMIFLVSAKYFRSITLVVVLYMSTLGFITYQSAKTWGNDAALALNWAQEHPQSARAQFSAMRFYLLQGDIDSAASVVEGYSKLHPDAAAFHLLSLVFENCYRKVPVVDEDRLQSHLEAIKVSNFDRGSHAGLALLQDLYDKDACSLNFEHMKSILQAYLDNKKFENVPTTKAHFYMQLATLYKSELNFNGMMQSIDAAYDASPQFMFLITKSVYLADAGIYFPALCVLEQARNGADPNKFSYFYKSGYIDRQEQYVRDAALKNGYILEVGDGCAGI